MKQLNRTEYPSQRYPTKVLQFGEGNFLRAFIDWQIDRLNEEAGLAAGVSIVRPIDYDSLPLLNTQDGLYTTIVRGIDETGQNVEQSRIIGCVNEEIPVYKDFDAYMKLAQLESLELVFSNTTEAGIEYVDTDKLTDRPAKSFPAKLTQWLYRRFSHFRGDESRGLTIVPCELIDYNGEKLKSIVLQYAELWSLDPGFVEWLHRANHFCSTLVDRIVTGYPHDERDALAAKLGYEDRFMVTCEYFHLFVIQGPESIKETLRLDQCALNIKVVEDIYPYKQRKVAILNGAHTALVPLAFMAGVDSVGEAMADSLLSAFVERLMFDEIIPTLDLPKGELEEFARDVLKRFRNPFIHHRLLSIALNSMTKFRTRVVPQMKKQVAMGGKVPPLMTQALAGQILLYRGVRGGESVPLSDSPRWLELFSTLWKGLDSGQTSPRELVEAVLAAEWHWEEDLTRVPGLVAQVTSVLEGALAHGVRPGLEQALGHGAGV